MRLMTGRRSIATLLMLLTAFLAASARACLLQGNAEPCHCVENMLLSVTRAAEPVGSPTLTGSLQSSAPPITAGVEVGSNYYHTDINPGDGAGDGFGNVTIHVGDTVHWAFSSGHTVTATPNSLDQFDSGFLSSGQSFDRTFNTAGHFQYYCQLHSFTNANGSASGPQVGTVTVLPVPEPGSLTLLAIGVIAFGRKRK